MNRIDALFAKMALTYGSRMATMHGEQSPAMVKAHWAHELRRMPDWAIAYGLDNLPATQFPPNVLEFKALCQRATGPQAPRIAAPRGKVAPEAVRSVLGALKGALTSKPTDPLAWAKNLKAKHEGGGRLTVYQREAYQRALRIQPGDGE